ncbi:MAG: NAD-dependent epimerase/dehydratase family protein [Candidatus Rokuibacteriota bacterium]
MVSPLPDYHGRSVLITGGLGFIGSNLARRLVEMGGVEVILVDAMLADQGGNLFNLAGIADRLTYHVADIGCTPLLDHLVAGRDCIFNLAGSTSHVDSMRDPRRDLDLNCAAQLALLEACRRVNPRVKIVFTSTRQVYGKALYLPVDEQHPVAPPDINGIHELTAEQYHLLYHRLYGLRPVVLRLTNVYGPRQLLRHPRQSFIAWFIRQAIEGGTIELFGGGRQQRDVTYVDDVVEALLLAGASAAADGEIFNLGGQEPRSVAELAAELITLTGRGIAYGVPFPPERQLIDIGHFYSSFAKIERVLGWRPRTALGAGLGCTIEFYQRHRAHYWTSDADTVPRSPTSVPRA